MSEEEKRQSAQLFSWLIEPSPNINYDFVSGMYAIGSLLCFLLYIFQITFEVQKDDTGDVESSTASVSEAISELVTSLSGVYLIFVPFFPCLLWSLIIRSKWQKLQIQIQENDEKKTK